MIKIKNSLIFEKLKSKKIIILFIIILLFSAGLFIWWQRKEEPKITFVPTDEFIERKTNGEKIIEHKKSGLEMKVPLDWQIIDSGYGLFLASIDFKPRSETSSYSPLVPEKGCIFEVSIKAVNSDEQIYFRNLIDSIQEFPDNYPGYEVIEIGKHNGFKHIYSFEDESFAGDYVIVRILNEERVYIFEAYLFSEDKEKCTQEFEEFLNKILIE